MSTILAVIAVPLGWLLRTIYQTVGNYGVALILFTLFTKILLFPLSIKQQKSTAKQAAYTPMIQEINKKWANDKARQQQELQKMQEEYGFSPMSGCLPLLIQFPIMFGLIDVIYKPLRYVIGLSNEVITAATDVASKMMTLSSYSPQSTIIQAIQQSPDSFSSIVSADKMELIRSFNPNFLGFNLTEMPTFAFNMMLLIPILSVVTMILLQWLTTRLNGTSDQMQGGMKIFSYSMSIMFGWIAFKVPAGVSLYWIMGNIFGIIQAFILKKMYDPEVYKAQLAAEIEEKRQAKKAKKKVKIAQEDGTTAEKEVSEAELARIRLEKARKLDEQRYKD